MNDLIATDPQTHQLQSMVAMIEAAKSYADNSHASNTKRAYRSDWADFEGWCQLNGLKALPAEPGTIALYLTDRASTLKASSLARRLATLRQAHQMAGFHLDTRHPLINKTWKGIKNTIGTAQKGKNPVLIEDLREMMELLPATLHGVRNRALLLLGFSGAFRRSELTGLEIADLSFNRDGITVQLRRSKTDQEGSGRQVAIPYGTNGSTCPVRAVQDWIAGGGIVSGPLFRAVDRHGRVQQERLSDQSVANIVKQSVRAIASARGMDFAAADEFSSRFAGHSLRAGLATSAAMAGATESSIMRQTGHRRADTVRKYIRLGTLFTDNAAARVGL